MEERLKNRKQVKVNSKVKVLMTYDENEKDTVEFTLIDGEGNTIENKISIDSPLGSLILEKNVGYVGKYKVNGNIIKIEILDVN